MNTVKGYEKLVAVYQDAHDQAAKGKGDERHANGQPFHEQRMQQISGLLRSSDGMAFQAIKKLTEGLQFEDHARREAELLGALNYIAGIVIYYRESQDTHPLDNDASLVYNADRLVIKNSEGDVIFDSNGVPPTNEPPREYTLEEVIGGVTLSDWARWVAVDKDGEVYEFSDRPFVAPFKELWTPSDDGDWNWIKDIDPPADFTKCIWEIIRKGNELRDE